MVHSPRYVRNQSTPTTKTVVRTYSSCVTLFYTEKLPGIYYMDTSTFLRAQLDLNVFLPARVSALFRNTCVT